MTNEAGNGLPYQECPEGRLSTRDMVGYQRAAAEDAFAIPSSVNEHLAACPVCRKEWERIARTDRTLKTHRKRQAVTIVRELKAVEEWDRPAENPLTEREREALAGWLREDLMGASAEQGPAVEGLGWKEIVKLCDETRLIDNDEQRYQEANALAKAFRVRGQREQPKKLISLETMGKILEADLVIAGTEEIPEEPGALTLKLKSAEELAALASLAAGVTAVSYLQISPKLLEKRGECLVFRSRECGRRQPDMEKVAKRFTLAAVGRR